MRAADRIEPFNEGPVSSTVAVLARDKLVNRRVSVVVVSTPTLGADYIRTMARSKQKKQEPESEEECEHVFHPSSRDQDSRSPRPVRADAIDVVEKLKAHRRNKVSLSRHSARETRSS